MLIWREQECARDAGLPIAAMKSGRGFTRAFTGQEPDWDCCGVVTSRGAWLPGPGGQTAAGGGTRQVVPAVLHEVVVDVHGLSCLGEPAGDAPAGWFHRGRRPARSPHMRPT